MATATVSDVAAVMEAWAPLAWAEEWDNVGLLVGEAGAPAQRVLVALEVTDPVLAEAEAMGAQMLVVHHPVIFRGLKALRPDTAAERRLLRLVRAGMAVYAAHTNLDVAPGGTNDLLAAAVGMVAPAILQLTAPDRGHGRIGLLDRETTVADLAARVKAALGVSHVRLVGAPEARVARAAVAAGSGGSLVPLAAAQGAQVLVTGDVDHHDAHAALDAGMAVIDPGHYATEAIVADAVANRLQAALEGRGLSARCQPARSGWDPFGLL